MPVLVLVLVVSEGTKKEVEVEEGGAFARGSEADHRGGSGKFSGNFIGAKKSRISVDPAFPDDIYLVLSAR